MSAPRPTISAELLSAIIESAPDRVRSRLDRSPDVASTWQWQLLEETWSIDTGSEVVTLAHGQLISADQLSCTCLLTPKCFHILAALMKLEICAERPQEPSQAAAEPEISEVSEDLVELDDKQQLAAREMVSSVAQILRVGIANTGVVTQSSLLRAVHRCRTFGLHRLAALGLKIVAGTNEFRQRTPSSDPAQLADDIAEALETGMQLLDKKAVESVWIGTARRKQLPIRPRRLHGLFAEPIITRSGFAGAAAYFLGDDNGIYTASDVRTGDLQHARDAYFGGIEIGSIIQPAKQLARSLYIGTDLTASRDGRLGRGKSIKIIEQGQSSWQFDALQKRFRDSLVGQWNAMYSQVALPNDARPAGWDFLFVQGTVLGAIGPELLFQPDTDDRPLRLAIESEVGSLYYRENLRMLSHAPGLKLQVIARVNLQSPQIAAPLAIALPTIRAMDEEPRLDIPESWCGRICLGFNEIQRSFLVGARTAPWVLTAHPTEVEHENPLGALRRRWIAAMLSGLVSQRSTGSSTLAAETANLYRMGFVTAAGLLDALTSAPENSCSGSDIFLATALYLRHGSYELARYGIDWHG